MKQKKYYSITSKVNLMVLLCILVVMVLIGTAYYWWTKAAILANIESEFNKITERLEYSLKNSAWYVNKQQIEELLILEMEYPYICAIVYEDIEQRRGNVGTIGKMRTSQGNIVLSQDGPSTQSDLRRCIKRHQPLVITFQERNLAKVSVYTDHQVLQQTLQRLLLQILALFVLLFLALYGIIVFTLRRLILSPIALIYDAVQQVTSGNFSIKIPPMPPDELGRLGESFNRMANTIAKHHQELEQKVRERTEELAKANQFQSRFFANITHEFRTPLTIILAPIEALIVGEYGEMIPNTHRIFRSMLSHGSRLLKLITHMLDFSKIDAGEMTINRQRTRIDQYLKLCVSSIQAAAESQHIQLIFNDNTDGVEANIDRELFEKAIFNLISNALKFTSEGGHILVQLDKQPPGNITLQENLKKVNSCEDPKFVVSVKDSGIGIPENKLHSIFDRFSQLRSGEVSPKYQGAGIGLALTKEIVELHGGTITVDSPPGKGSTFTMMFPSHTSQASYSDNEMASPEELADITTSWFVGDSTVASKETDRTLPNQNAPTILLVEDSTDMRSFLAALLCAEFHVLEAQNGREGLHKALAEAPDLIIADIMMPEMDGTEMLREIRTNDNCKGIPILLLTAREEEALRIQSLEQGADDYIMKPFNVKELKARIHRNLDMKRLRDESECRKEALEQRTIELEQALEQIQEKERLFREMAEWLPSIILDIDLDGNFLYVNRAGQEFFGITPQKDKQPPLSITTYLRPDRQECFWQKINHLADQRSITPQEFFFVDATDKEHSVLFTATPAGDTGSCSRIRLVILEVQAALNLIRQPEQTFCERYGLTPREKEVLVYVVKGFRNKEIAEQLYIGEGTVKKHISNILAKTKTQNRSKLVKLIRNQGYS